MHRAALVQGGAPDLSKLRAKQSAVANTATNFYHLPAGHYSQLDNKKKREKPLQLISFF